MNIPENLFSCATDALPKNLIRKMVCLKGYSATEDDDVGYDHVRFWGRVNVTNNKDDCWKWGGASSNGGHGRFKLKGKLVSPHRHAYQLVHGDIPKIKGKERLIVRHKCDNPSCCNPYHLELGTYRDNAIDMVKRGRHKNKYTNLRNKID